MPNVFERFHKRIVGSQNNIADITNKIIPSGDFGRIYGLDTILQSWSNILSTPRRTYFFDPIYGSELYKLIFEPADNDTISAIIQEVRDVLITNDNRAKIININVEFLTNKKGFNVNVLVEYAGKRDTISVTIDENNYFNLTGRGAIEGG